MCLPRSLRPPTERIPAMPTTTSTAVADYVAALEPPVLTVAERLVALVGSELPGAEGALWHGHPVWRVGGEPAVLVKAYSKHVTLGFWRGRLIDGGGGLTPSGGQEMASVKVTAEPPAEAAAWLRQVPALHPAS
jgi:hypothetical protein